MDILSPWWECDATGRALQCQPGHSLPQQLCGTTVSTVPGAQDLHPSITQLLLATPIRVLSSRKAEERLPQFAGGGLGLFGAGALQPGAQSALQ